MWWIMIVAKNLVKTFGKITAIDNVNFCINKGEVICLLGPNGAGKTTLMRLLTGYLEPSEGDCSIYGHNLSTSRVDALRKIGYVPENCPLYPEMSTYEFIKFTADIWGVSNDEFVNNFKELVRYLHLEEVINQQIETLSKGFKRRVGIAAALIHRPKVLILDEPTEGLDPNQKFEIRNFIREYGKSGIVVVSTHIMEEVEAISTRVLLLNRGKLIRDTTPQELKKTSSNNDMASAFRQITNEGF